MAGIVDRFLNFVGLEDVEEEEAVMEQDGTGGSHTPQAPEWSDEVTRQRRRGGLVPLPASRAFRVVVMHPRTLEDGQVIADQVKNRRPVIVNLDTADERSQQRLLNFLSGVAYALDGGLRQVGDSIYLVTPSNVEVATEDRPVEEGPGSWVRGQTR